MMRHLSWEDGEQELGWVIPFRVIWGDNQDENETFDDPDGDLSDSISCLPILWVVEFRLTLQDKS